MAIMSKNIIRLAQLEDGVGDQKSYFFSHTDNKLLDCHKFLITHRRLYIYSMIVSFDEIRLQNGFWVRF